MLPSPLSLDPEQSQRLEELVVGSPNPSIRRRAQILLGYAQGKRTRDISAEVGISRTQVRYWRRQFRQKGMSALEIYHPASRHAVNHTLQEVQPEEPGQTEASEETASIPEPSSQVEPILGTRIFRDDLMSEAGRKLLLVQFNEMLQHEQGTRQGDDIEDLHDMRVATRRMRAAFDVFSNFYTKKTVNKHLKGLRKIGRALGEVRDLDVLLEKTSKSLEKLSESERQSLDPLLSSWRQNRDTARQNLIQVMDSPAYEKFKTSLSQFLSSPGKGACPVDNNPPEPALVCEVAPPLIYSRMADSLAYERILDTASFDQLHALRIQFKKLRYAIEFFREVLGSEAEAVIKVLKKNQDHLGDLHDAVVATQLISAYLAQLEARQADRPITERENAEPVAAFLGSKYAERHNLLITYRDTWALFDNPDYRQKLGNAIAVI